MVRTSTLAVALLLASALTHAEQARISTPLGDIEIELLEQSAPQTVANFRNYIDDGDYVNSFIHRSVPEFIIQGGGFTFADNATSEVPTDPPVTNEFEVSNTRGTVAMAKLGGDPNSATSQWFINLDDNSSNLDNQNGGFTVFARVIGDGMEVADAIAALQIWNAGGAFSEIPLIDYTGQGDIQAENLVFTSVVRDRDEDGVYDDEDAFPDNPEESVDTDMDMIGNNADEDDDGDGLPDEYELSFGLDPLDPEDAEGDLDDDGFSNLQEFNDGTDPSDPNSNDGILKAIIMLLIGGDDETEE